MRIGDDFAVHSVCETPLAARDNLSQAIGRVTHRQNVFRTGRIIDGIAFSAGWSEKKMAERHVL